MTHVLVTGGDGYVGSREASACGRARSGTEDLRIRRAGREDNLIYCSVMYAGFKVLE